MERKLRLLCLDGGGVRGLASLYLLKKLMAQVGNRKPCDFFDMIGGTSTGGLIAVMLGRLEMDIETCIDAFTEMMDEIFQRKHKFPFELSGKVRGRYSSVTLEKCIKKVITDAGFPVDAKMRDQAGKKYPCKTFVVAMTDEARSIVTFTDYKKRFGGDDSIYDDAKIWEVARATSAASSFFDPMAIKRNKMERVFLDGGLGSNNPVDELWQEATDEWGPTPLAPQVRCLLSIGTGKPRLEVFGTSLKAVADTIIKIATETQKTADKFERNQAQLFNEDYAFRFNPPDIDVGLEDAEQKGRIAARTESYTNEAEFRRRLQRFMEAAGEEQNLKTKRSNLSPTPSIPRSYPYTALTKGKNHIAPDSNSYWRHLTLASIKIYEDVYENCKDRRGRVIFSSFLQQFPPNRMNISTVTKVWSRLLNDTRDLHSSVHPKGFTMAVLYMLHIETYTREKPQDDNKKEGVASDRRKLLKRFGNWVPCRCESGCGLEWNFGNDVGLHRGGDEKKCAIAMVFGKLSLAKISIDRELGFMAKLKEDWMNSSWA